MTYRAALAAGLGVVALTVATPAPASACDPQRFPYCQSSYCRGVAVVYGNLARHVYDVSENVATDPSIPVPLPLALPAWPQTGVAGCP